MLSGGLSNYRSEPETISGKGGRFPIDLLERQLSRRALTPCAVRPRQVDPEWLTGLA